jgi:nitrate reductase (NAD(P)H)
VYDATKYLPLHPGGEASILITAGQDCTEDFEALHSSKAWKLLDEYYIGELAGAKPAGALPVPPPATPAGPPLTLDKAKYVTLPLEWKKTISHDTRVFRFQLPSKEHELGLPVGQHLFIRAKGPDGANVMRAYTPMGCGAGYVDFVIKVYFANVHPRFPEGGKLTQILEGLKEGDTIDVKGPLGEYVQICR